MMGKNSILPCLKLIGCALIAGLVIFLPGQPHHPPGHANPFEHYPDTTNDAAPAETLPKNTDVPNPLLNQQSGASTEHRMRNSSVPDSSDEMAAAFLKVMVQSPGTGHQNEKALIGILLDATAPPKDRHHAAWVLAKTGGEEAFCALRRLFAGKETSPYLKAAAAEGLGCSSNPQALELLLTAMEYEDEIVVRGAIRGLAAMEGEDAVFKLSHIMNFSDASQAVIAEAAAALGRIESPDAALSLFLAYQNAEGQNTISFKQDILSALGSRDIAETGGFFQSILDDENADPALRLSAIIAAGNARGDVASFLIPYLNDAEAEIRGEAAWALALAEDPGDMAAALKQRLADEEDVEVRKRLYQALANQGCPSLDALSIYVYQENDLATRIAGYDFLARGINAPENAQVAEKFNNTAIPELRWIAVSDANLNLKISAVIALKRAGTLNSLHALEEIAAETTDDRVAAATGINL